MKPKMKKNGTFYIDTEVPNGTGGLRRARIGFDTKDPQEANRQLMEWKLGTHAKHPNQGAVIAPKGWSNGSSGQTVASKGMTVERLLQMCWQDRNVWANSKSQKTIKSNIKLMSERIGTLHPRDVTASVLRQLEEDMRERYAPASIQRKFSMLQTALRKATEYTFEDAPILVAAPTFPKITVENKKDRVLTEYEEQIMFECIEARRIAEPLKQWWRFRWYCRILLVTGFRRAEGLLMGPDRVDHIERGNKRYTMLRLFRYETKNNKPHELPIPTDVIEAIPALNAQAVNGKWFPIEGILWYSLVAIKEDCKARGVNIDDVGLHTLRHTCITRLARSGKLDLLRLSRWANHSSVTVTASRYAHLLTQDLLDGLSVFE